MTLHYEEKGKRAYYVAFDRIVIHKETRIKYAHLEGSVITKKTWETITQDNAYYLLLDRALYKLSFKAHTEQSLKERLEGEPILVRQVLDALKKLGYINDARLLEDYLRDYEFETKSLSAYKTKLLKKGFQKALLDARFETFDDDQAARLEQALEAKFKTLKPDTWLKTSERLMRYGASLGYSYTLLNPAVAAFKDRLNVDLDALLKKEVTRLKKDPKLTRQKIIDRLRRKGFSYDRIKPYVKEES